MIIWKLLKYKHTVKAQQISAGLDAGTATEQEFVEFVVGLVESWDFVDAETGQPIQLADYGELTISQFNELAAEFNLQMHGTRVKKTNPVKSSYGSMPLKAGKTNSRRRPRGSIPS